MEALLLVSASSVYSASGQKVDAINFICDKYMHIHIPCMPFKYLVYMPTLAVIFFYFWHIFGSNI